MAKSKPDRIDIFSINVPGYSRPVDAAKYAAMKKALLKCLPKKAPGLSQAEMFTAVVAHLPRKEFPGGAKAEWWCKCVQLDLEARGELRCDRSIRPLRWHRA